MRIAGMNGNNLNFAFAKKWQGVGELCYRGMVTS